MKEIPLTQGKVALVDDEDYLELSKYKWQVRMYPKTGYATRAERIGGNVVHYRMHRLIMRPPYGKDIDHINGNGLDNRRENLRIVSRRKNLQNRHTPKTSQYPGVSWYNRKKRWKGDIRYNGKSRHLGYYKDELEAATVYRVACKVLFNEDVL